MGRINYSTFSLLFFFSDNSLHRGGASPSHTVSYRLLKWQLAIIMYQAPIYYNVPVYILLRKKDTQDLFFNFLQ